MDSKSTAHKKIIQTAIWLLIAAPITISSAEYTEHHLENTEIECLARNMTHEARGEGKNGLIAVANVTMNRVKSKLFPTTVCGVVYQKNKKTCQFSWACTSKAFSAIPADIRQLASRIYNGGTKDLTRGALFFHSVNASPVWANSSRFTIQIGNHLFYKGSQ